jgi:hypothetical protein
VHARRARGACALQIGHRGQRLVVDVDQRGGVLGDVPVVGHDEGDDLTDVADLVDRQRHLRPRVRQRRMRDQQRPGLVERAEIGGGGDEMNARHPASPRGVDRTDARVRVRAAQARAVERAGQAHVVHEAREAAEQPWILDARHTRSDHARGHRASPAKSSLARRTARTMFW